MKTKRFLLIYVLPLAVLIPAILLATSSSQTNKTVTNSLGMEFVLIPSGTFKMGVPERYQSRSKNDIPQHPVTISRPFYIGKYEVTQEQWVAVMTTNPSKYPGGKNPVERVSWLDVQEFIKRLNQREKTRAYRLPTEAEWEYACRANSTTQYYFGDSDEQLSGYAWYDENADNTTHPVGQLEPNAWGLYDILGNVWEWCQDVYDSDCYQDGPAVDPQGPAVGNCRVIRGGSWHSIYPYRLRCSFRFAYPYYGRLPNFGFRLVMDAEKGGKTKSVK